MDDARALQLLDAHLDQDEVTDEQAQELAVWLKAHPEHADRAFRRICLHAFLRQRFQYESLVEPTGLTTLPQPLELAPYEERPTLELRDQSRARLWWPWLGVLVVGACVLGLGMGLRGLLMPLLSPAGLWAYEGFDYPPTYPPVPMGDSTKWPTAGGIQGLAGGTGWAEPWQEAASKVSVLIGDVQANAWRDTDQRLRGPLQFQDARGDRLVTTGIQLRAAAGPSSNTIRRLSVTSFPPEVVDERGVGRDGSVVWLSFLAQSFDGRGLNNFAYVQLGTDTAGVRFGKLASVFSGNWSAAGIQDGAELNSRSSDIPSGQAVFVVARIKFRAGREQVDVWFDPPLRSEPSTSTASIQLAVPDFRFDQLSIGSRYSTDFDELRIGGTFHDVAPILQQLKP